MMIIDFNEDCSIRDLAEKLTVMSLEETLGHFLQENHRISFFSTDPKEEAKEVKKMKKALIRVLSYYSVGGVYEVKKSS